MRKLEINETKKIFGGYCACYDGAACDVENQVFYMSEDVCVGYYGSSTSDCCRKFCCDTDSVSYEFNAQCMSC